MPPDEPAGTPADPVIGPEFAPARRSGIAWVELDGEAVLYDADGGGVHALNPTATLVWQLLDGTATLATLADELAEAFAADPRQIAGDLEQLVGALATSGVLAGTGPSPADPELAAGAHADHDHADHDHDHPHAR